MSHKRKIEDKHRLKKLYEETKNSYGAGAWFNKNKNRYIRYTCHNKWLKKYCSKAIRRKMKNMEVSPKGNDYRKIFDYWWELL